MRHIKAIAAVIEGIYHGITYFCYHFWKGMKTRKEIKERKKESK